MYLLSPLSLKNPSQTTSLIELMFTFLYFEAKNAAGHNNFEAKVLK